MSHPPRSARPCSAWLRLVPAAGLLLASCAAREPLLVPRSDLPRILEETNGTPTAQAPAAADVAVLEALYARLEDHRLAYQDGLDLIVAGDEVAGEDQIGEVAENLIADAERCEETPGCSIARFLDMFDYLLTLQGIELKKQASRITEFEASLEDSETETTDETGTSPFVNAMPEIGETVSLLRGTEFREMIELNGPVKAALDDWLTWMRPNLMNAYRNYQFLRDEVAPIYDEAGLPEALLFAMIATESGGKVHARSRAGAAGPLQFMRRTGQIYGLRTVNGFDTRYDPAAATRANVAYLNDRFEELNDSLEKSLAAYNGGEGRMRVLERRFPGSSLWDRRLYYSLPRETREYVPRVLAAAWLFLHPGDYNLEWPVPDVEKTKLVLERDASLSELTVCLGQVGNPDGWFRTLRNLNPKLEPRDRHAAGTEITLPAALVPVYRERCLEGEILERALALHEAAYPEGPEMIPYVVRRGDTLGRIARRHRCASLSELAALNRIRPPRYTIRVGQVIKIPGCR